MIVLAAAAMMAAACDPATKSEVASLTISMEMDGSAYAQADKKVSITDINTSATFDGITDAQGKVLFKLLPGIYEANVSFQIQEENKTVLVNGLK